MSRIELVVPGSEWATGWRRESTVEAGKMIEAGVRGEATDRLRRAPKGRAAYGLVPVAAAAIRYSSVRFMPFSIDPFVHVSGWGGTYRQRGRLGSHCRNTCSTR
jgi:hypothetical protein